MLKGKKVFLRAPELEDTRLLSVWLNDREANRNLDIIYPLSKRHVDSFILEGDENSEKRLYIIDNEDRKSIGIIIIDNIKWEYRNCEVGIVIYDRNSRGKGFGRDAMETILKFIFEEMNMHLVYLKVFEKNKTALNLYNSLGFEMEGLLKDRYYKEGKYSNLIIMSRVKEEN